ncbi:MAG: Ig-like domain-containing protein [Pikeienuella sp.]|uniref:Ig-like domain-containing protein n=1 Tax=Pikeienuella sp. TaxID=2831957 RepID=UPI003919C769
MASLSDIQVVVLTPGEDSVAGGAGAPGGSGSPVIHGDLGDDTITGGAANETIMGGSGADQLDGGQGDDVLYGGLGDDFLVYDFDDGGADRLFGGAGRDTLVLRFSSAYFSESRQAEIAAYLALLSAGQDPGRGDEFAFETFGLRATSIENLLLFIDGAPADPNAPPRGAARPDSFSVSEDATSLTGDVSLNDGALDGDVFSLVDFDPEAGALDLRTDGSFVFTPGAQFQSLAVGETATVSFTYRLTTPGGSNVATATITVTGANDAPTANDAQAATDEDTPVTINLLDLSGAADPDESDTPVLGALAGFALDIQTRLVPLPSGAEAEGAAGGVVTFDPRGAYDFLSEGETAQETFAFVVSDGNGGLVTRNLTVTIAGLNDAPVAVDDSAGATEGGAVVVELLANDFDPDANDSISLVGFDDEGSAGGVLFEDEETGDLVFDADGAFEDLGAGDTRTTTFSYTIVDGFGAEATGTLTVTVTGLNDAPQGGFLSENLTEDETLTGNLILDGGVTDVDATDVLTIIAVDGAPLVGGAGVFTLSTGATLAVSANGGFTYDPRAAFDSLTAQGVSGEFFTVTVSDGNGGETELFASLTILGVNDAPVAVADSVAAFSDRASTFDPLANDFDVDGPFDLVDFDANGSAGGTLGNVEGSLRFDPGEDFLDLAPGATRTTTFAYTIADDAGAEATATITVTVTGVALDNNPPEGGAFTLEIGEDDFVEDDLFSLSGAFDPDQGDSIRVIAVDGAPVGQGPFFLDSGLFLTVDEDGFFTLDAAGAFDFLREGERIGDEFTVTIADLSGEEALITATIDIIGLNDSPELSPLDFTFSQNDFSGLLGLLDNAFDAEDDPLSISFFGQIEGPNVFGSFGPAAVRYDGFTSFAGLEPTPIGDVNGDGFGDFFLGSGGYLLNEGATIQGGRVILGGAANRTNADLADGAYDGVINLAQAGLPGVLAVEPETGTYSLGAQAAVIGDLNGDGFDDFLVSDNRLSEGQGVVHVIFGGPGGGGAFSPSFSPSQLDGANGFTILGEDAGGGLGRTVSTRSLGDIDGDGIADFLLSAQEASPNGQGGAGSAFIVSGGGLVSAAGGAASIGIGAAVAAGGLRLDGTQAYYSGYDEGFYLDGGRVGGALAAGDIDGDGIADILIGAPGEIAASGTGVTYLIFGDDPAALETAFGGTAGVATLTQATVAAAGGFALLNAGSVLAVIGDVNGDGFADFFVGAHYTEGGPENYIVFGGRASLSALDAEDGAADGRINLDRVQGEYGFVLSGLAGPGYSGRSVTAPGDVDGDGLADLLIGGYPSYDEQTGEAIGRVFLLFGGGLDALDAASVQDGAISVDEVDGTTGYVFEARGDTSFGVAVSSGDFDGDGAADLLISDTRFRNESNQPVGTTYLISDAGAKLATLDALDGQIDGRIDADILSGLFIDSSEPPAGAFTPFDDDAEFDPSLFAYLGAGEQETVAIEYGVFDGTDETVNTVTITITGENDAPFGFDVSFETDEDTLEALNILEASGAFDFDANDMLFVLEFEGLPLDGGTELFEFDEGATLEVSADGTVVIDADFDFLRAGEAFQYSFTFTVSDLAGETFTDNYNFTITGVNDAPVANDDAATTDEDTAIDVFVDENDDDADDDFTVVAIDAAGSAGGVLTERDLGGHVFDPNGEFDDLAAGETRETAFSYTIVDEAGEEATATLTVTVSGLNDAPTGGDASFTTDEDTDLAGDFLAAAGAADVDNGDALRLTAINGQALTAGQVSVTFGSGAVLTANEDGTFSFAAAGNYESLAEGESAAEAFSFTVADAAGASFTASATISVTGVNDAPVAVSDAVETDEDTAIEIDLGANDSDIDDGTLIFGFPDTTGEFGFADIVLDYNGAGDPTRALGSGDGVFVSVPTGTSLTVAFIDEVIFDGAGADLFIGEIGPGGERANIEVSSDGVNFTFIGVADNNTTTAFDLASIGFTEQLVAVRITGLDNGGSSPGFDVDFVQAVGVDVEGTRGNLTDLGGGVVNYDPSGALDFLREGETFIDLFTYSVTDAFGAASVAVVEVTVTGVNDAPTGEDASFSTDEDTDLSGDFLAASAATDLDDGDALRLTAINGQALTAGQVSVTFGSGAVLTANEDGTFSLSVAGNYEALNDGESASEAFSFTVADEAGASFTASATIRIDGVTDGSLAPVAGNDSATVNEESQITVAVLNNDTAPGGGPLTTSLAAGQTFIGAVTVLANQSIQFNPAGAYDFLGVGESATETIRYLATDSSNGLSDEGLFTITITGVNDRPTGGSITDQTDEDTALTGNVIADSGASDRDANDVLRVLDVIIGGVRTGVTGTQSFTTASGATLTISEDGTYEYSPVGAFDALFAGETSAPDAFSVTLDDQSGAGLTTATVTLSIAVTGVNDAPVANDDAFATDEDTGIEIAPEANDLDAEDDFFIAEIDTAGSAGGRISTGEGFVFDPNGEFDDLAAGESRTTTFSYTIEDAEGARDTATITVTVTGVNDAPVANGDAATTDEDTSVSVDVLANDDDVDDGFSLAGFDTAGSAGGSFDGSVFDPNGEFDDLAAGETRTTTFSYTIRDDAGAEDSAVLTVTVTGVNDAPVANDDAATTDEDTAVSVDVLANDEDVDDGFSLVGFDAAGGAGGVFDGSVFDPNGEFDDLAAGESRTTSFSYTIRDDAGAEDSAVLTVTVTGVNDAPTGADVFFGPLEEDAIGFGFLIESSNATDPDAGDTLSVTAVNGQPLVAGEISFTLGSGATLTVQANGEAQLGAAGFYDELDEGDTLDEVFSFTISDAAGASFTASATFRILGVNDPLIVSAATDPDPVPEGDVGVLSNVQFDLISFVTATDADEDDTPAVDPASVSIVANAASDTADASSFAVGGGSVVVDTANFDFLAGGESGIFDVTFDIVSGAERVTRTITITITGEDDGPVANDDAATTDEDTAISIDVLANDTPGEFGLRLVPGQEFGGQAGFDAGRLLFDPSGEFDFLAVGETATESIFYEIRDGETGLTDTAEVRITITGVNDAPVSESGGTPGLFVEPIDEDTLFTANMIAGTNPILDADENDVLRVTVVDGRAVTPGGISFTGSSGAAITVSENGDISIDPRGALDFLTGSDATGEFFFYTVSDGNGGEIQGFVSLSIFGVNDAPEVTAINIEASELDGEFEVDLFEFARDAENDTLTISDFRQVSGLTAIAGEGLAGMRFEGDIDYGYAGDPAGLGDINGDGIDDFVVFRPATSEGEQQPGFIIFGESPAQATLDTADGARDAVANAGLIDAGTGLLLLSASNYGGRYLGAGPMGDINGDGFAELLIADTYAGPNNGGAVFVTFGGREAIEALGGTLDLSAFPAGAGFRLSLGAIGDYFGGVLPAAPVGDVNGDGLADLLIGSERLNRNDAFVHFVSGGALAGAADAAGNVDVDDLLRAADGSAYRFVGGPETGGEGANFRDLGLATGDIDGDGIDDFLISASIYNYDLNGPGASFIVFGGRDALDAADQADGSRDSEISLNTIGAAGGFTLIGAAFQPAVIGDVNGDGFADFAVADREGYGDGLNVFVLFGGRDNLAGLDDADGVRDGRLDPFRAAEEGFGLTFRGLTGGEGGLQAEIVPLGDIDGDGLTDFAIANGSNRLGGGGYAGEVHIALSSTLFQADNVDGARDQSIDVGELYTIRATPSTTTSGTGATFADRIASADINGDGFLDLLIGESRFFDGARFASGAVHVVFGGGAIRLREIDSGNDQFIQIAETLGVVTATGNRPAGALVFDDPVSFNPDAFGFLEADEEEVLVFEFTVSDGQAETVNTLTITVTGAEPDFGFGQFLSAASKPMVADESAFGLDEARSVEVPEPADARFFGSAGSERIDGTEDDDVIRAGDGNDRVIAEEGRDLIFGEGGDDDLRGGKGRDTIFGGAGDDTMLGQGGFDQLSGGRGEDVLNGGRGDDLLRGNRDDDTVIGGAGNDTLFGGRNNDLLNGGGGADRLNGGRGADTLIGSFGVDTFVFQRGFGNDRLLDFQLFETLDFSGHDSVAGLGDLTITERGADTLIEDGLGGRLVLVGIDSADLDVDNFLF